jgi:hypothetical protein
LTAQVAFKEIIDCGGKGNCQGGTVGDVYEYAKTHGLVEEGCNNYRANNGSKGGGGKISRYLHTYSYVFTHRFFHATGLHNRC